MEGVARHNRKQKPQSCEMSEEPNISGSNKKPVLKSELNDPQEIRPFDTAPFTRNFFGIPAGKLGRETFFEKVEGGSSSVSSQTCATLRTNMNFSGYRYYKLNYGILKFLRLWNTEPKAPEVLLRLVMLYSFLMGSVVQVAALCMNEYSVTEICRIMIFIHCSYSFFNKYLMLYIHIKKRLDLIVRIARVAQVKFLFARVERDWNRLDNTDEYDILKRYTESSKLVRTIFILPGSLVTVMYGYAPIVLDFLMPLNESRPRRFLFAVEFFVIDPVEHFVSINTILSIVIFLGVATMTIIDGSVVMFIMHNCAMFKIAGHRLQRAINGKGTPSVRTKLVEATMIHQGAIEFADVQREIYSISYFGFLVLGSTSITMTLYTLSNAVKVTQAIRELTEAAYFLIFQFSYLFLCNYASQLLINHSSNVFGIIYDTEWYSIPVPVQKFIILIMKRSLQPCILTLGKMYLPSCEGFAMICNMSMSYFMFLFSIQ